MRHCEPFSSLRRLGPLALLFALAVLAPGGGESSAAPTGAAGEPVEHLLVLQAGGDLKVFGLPERTLLATIPLGGHPARLAATPDGRKAFVSDPDNRRIRVIDLRGSKVTRTIRAEGIDRPGDLRVTPDGRSLLVASPDGNRLLLIDARREVVLRSVTTTQKGTHTLTLAKGGRRALLTNRLSGSVSIVDLPALKILRHLKVGPGPEGIAVSPNGRWAILGLPQAGQVALLDLGTQQVLGRLPAGSTPLAMEFTPNSFNALVVNRDSDDVSVLDVLGRRLRKTLPVGRRPTDVALNKAGTRAYVCNSGSGTVSVLHLPGLEVGETITIGERPLAVAVVTAPGAAASPPPSHTTRDRASGGAP
jgi:YVTN family beta-propeller protein